MKKLLVLLFSLLISFNSYGESSEITICVKKDAQVINDTVYYPDKTTLFTGKNLCKYENGQVEIEGNYKDGLVYGKFTAWFESGQKALEETWIDRISIGKSIAWYENGQKLWEFNFKDGDFDGEYTWWYDDGTISLEAIYKDGECISGDCD